ncbi:MAG: diguanylate cyclase [Zoogloea sp.]|nr:diguanylate cyclase [Zoogloea sp.]
MKPSYRIALAPAWARRRLRWLPASLLALFFSHSVLALSPVTLQLKWTHAFQFAGYYAALEQGYYRDAGLDVRIMEAQPESDVVGRVVSGQADFGVGSSSLLMARKAGQPVVVLAVVFQHSPLVLISRKQHDLQSIHDLAGRRMMIEPYSDELLAYLKQEGVPLAGITQVPHTFRPEDLIAGKVDAMSAYATNETYYLQKAGIPYMMFSPRSVGIDFYGDNLFTSEQKIRSHPEQVRAFREASLRGWQYAMAHPAEIAGLIYSKYSQAHPLAFYLFEAKQMVPLIRQDLVELGYMSPGRWQHIADTYADLGMLPRDFSFDGFFYRQDEAPESSAQHDYLVAALVIIGLLSLLAAYVYHVNRRLAGSIRSLRQAKAALAESHAQFRTLTEVAAAGVFMLHGQKFVMVNPALVAMSGYTEEEVLALDFIDFVHPEHRAMVQERSDARLRGEEVPARYELKVITRDGRSRWVELTAGIVTHDEQLCSIGTVYDITDRKLIEEQIRHMAQHDPLTGLANRALFSDRVKKALAGARRDHTRLALMFLDLDRFKPINDELGHAVGDLLLKELAQRIHACVRDSDTVARIGGDEFVVLLRTIAESRNALAVAEKIRHSLAQPFYIEGHELDISASIGVAIFPEHGSDEIDLTKHADEAMYHAKDQGRDNVQLFQPPAGAALPTG